MQIHYTYVCIDCILYPHRTRLTRAIYLGIAIIILAPHHNTFTLCKYHLETDAETYSHYFTTHYSSTWCIAYHQLTLQNQKPTKAFSFDVIKNEVRMEFDDNVKMAIYANENRLNAAIFA